METIDVSNALNIPLLYLNKLARNSDKLYYSYYIKKKSGKFRAIDSPNKELKGVQRWINTNYLDRIVLPDCVHGFRKNHSIRTNASPHLGRKYIYCIDLKDFFPTITFSTVQNLFKKLSFSDEASTVLANLCTYKGYLPQGAVTSPSISNIIFSTIDDQIQSLCSKKRVSYTRYADDLSFSSNNKQVLIETVDIVKSEIISKSIFKINETKSRLMSGQKANIVTGLRLNSNKLSIGNKKKKLLRAKLHDYIINNNTTDENKLLGDLAFLRSIEQTTYNNFKKYIEKLKNRKTNN